MQPEDALALVRSLQDIAAAFLWGAYAFLGFLLPKQLSEDIQRRLVALKQLAIVLALLTTVLSIFLQAAVVGDGWADSLNFTVLTALVQTGFGQIWFVQCAACAALILRNSTPALDNSRIIAVTAASILAFQSLVGHSVAQTGMNGLVLQISYLIHVLAACAWVGAIIPLALTLKRLKTQPLDQDSELALTRFSGSGFVAVTLILITGIVNTMLVLGHLPLDWSQPYERLLLIKILFFFTMVSIAALNRYIFVPRAKASYGFPAKTLIIGLASEFAIGIVTVLSANFLGQVDPL